jgi:hypothetical protein
VLLDHPNAFDDDLVLGTVDLKDLSLGSPMVPGDNLDEVTGVYVCVGKLESGHGLKGVS